MAAHDNLIPYLSGTPGKAFVKGLTLAVYDWSFKVPAEYYNYRVFTEVLIRKETWKKTRMGLDNMKHFRLDAIFFIQPGNKALNQHQCYTVGIELKNIKPDLMHDEKMEEYLGYTNFFFIGVPENLVDDALVRAGNNYHIGVMNLENGEIVKLPKRNEVNETHRIEILEQILYNTLFNEIKSVVFKVEEVDVVEPKFKVPDKSEAQRQREEELRLQKEELSVQMEDAKKNLRHDVVKALDEMPLRQQRVFCIIHDAPEGIQAKDIIKNLPDHDSKATVGRQISELRECGLITRQGSKKTGRYVFNQDFVCKLKCSACAKAGECPDFEKLKVINAQK